MTRTQKSSPGGPAATVAVLLYALVAALVSVSLVVACSSGAGSPATTTAAVGPAPGTAAPRLAWRACDHGFQCASVQLPLDYANPQGERITVGVARKPAGDKAHRLGALFVNPGGPGVSAIDFMEGFAFPTELTKHFDIVAVDPRGVGRSTPVNCDEAPAKLYAPDPTMEDQADVDTYLKVSHDYVTKCRRRNGRLLDHVGSRDTVRDMDQVRAAMGDTTLSYLGFSYGTLLGETYADLFPSRVRAMVLDGVVDTSLSGVQGALQQAKGFEVALSHFFTNCQKQGSACAIGPDPAKVLDGVSHQVEAAPIASKQADRPAGPGELAVGLADALYSQSRWPRLAQALHDAQRGDGTGLVNLTDDYLDVSSGTEKNTTFDGYFAVSCVDEAWPRDAPQVLADAKAAAKSAPHFGEAFTNDYIRCALWPAKADPIEVPKAIGSPTILVIGTTGDPATPYAASVEVAHRLPKGILLTHDGEGHTAFGSASCVTSAATSYLVKLKTPAKGTLCKG